MKQINTFFINGLLYNSLFTMVHGNSFDKKWMAQRLLVWVSYFAKCLSEELLFISMFRFQADMFMPLPNSMIGMRNLCNTGCIPEINPNFKRRYGRSSSHFKCNSMQGEMQCLFSFSLPPSGFHWWFCQETLLQAVVIHTDNFMQSLGILASLHFCTRWRTSQRGWWNYQVLFK